MRGKDIYLNYIYKRNMLWGLIVCLGFVFFGCNLGEKGSVSQMNLESFIAIPGDKRVYLQWCISEGSEIFGIQNTELSICKVGEGGIGQYHIYDERIGNYLPKYGTFLDTTCLNGKNYGYYLFAAVVPEASLISDTIYAIPKQGLSNPVPPSPESLRVEYGDSTFTLKWISPQGNDSLYYIYGMDSSSSRWYTQGFSPIKLSQPEYTCQYSSDIYSKVAVFVNGILSLPSDSIEVIKAKK